MKQELQAIIRQAGEIILNAETFRVEQKEGHANFVTSVDEEVQRFLIRELQKLLPDSCIIGEEQENDALTTSPTWVVDPLDGTTNFIHNYRFSAISVALLENSVPVAGVVYQPYTQELFYAEKGKGAFLNDQPIHVSSTPIEHALVGFGTSPYNVELAEKSMNAALHFLKHAADVRRCGSAALDLRKLVENAILNNVSSVVLAHNHPSGIALPSPEDYAATDRAKAALGAIDVELADHIIVADGEFVSMKDSGWL